MAKLEASHDTQTESVNNCTSLSSGEQDGADMMTISSAANKTNSQLRRKKHPKYCIQWTSVEDSKLMGYVERFG